MVPNPGPPLLTFTIRQGSWAAAIYEIPSCIRLIPGLDDEVITRAPAPAPPYTILMDATSLSAWRTIMPRLLPSSARYSKISDCGVIG